MFAVRLIILVIYTALGLLLVAVSLPLIRRRVAPNVLYGFRMRRTLEDPKVWYDANEFAGRCLFRLGVATSAWASILFFVPALSPVAYAVASVVSFLTGMAVCMILSFRFLNRLPEN